MPWVKENYNPMVQKSTTQENTFMLLDKCIGLPNNN